MTNGSFTYTPDPGFFGVDSFTYKANDGELDSNIATVTITVNKTNTAPVANNDATSMVPGNGNKVSILRTGNSVLANDFRRRR
jgi:hypothetical protein